MSEEQQRTTVGADPAVNPPRPETVAVAAGRPHSPGAPLNQPIVLAAPFRHGDDGENAYQRDTGTDTVAAFETALGALDGGHAVAFASGMAAVAAVLESRPVGTVVVAPAQAYGGTASLLTERGRLGAMTVRSVDITDTAAVAEAVEGADLLWLETVTNPMLGVCDLPALIAAAHEADATVVVDATFSTPLNLRPLELGADITMHSATKAISGHSDLTMGALVGDERTAAQLRDNRTRTGATPGALESYLALRGLRTLPVRWERMQSNALALAGRLAEHPRVNRVRYPGLPGDPGHERARRDHGGFGSIVSFEVDGDADAAESVCAAVRLVTHATSLGGVETTMERRARHRFDSAAGVPESLIRLSVGIEHVEDLWADLDRALGG